MLSRRLLVLYFPLLVHIVRINYYLHCPLCLLQHHGILTVPNIRHYYNKQQYEEVPIHPGVITT